ncbi:uncharacterized protein LOC123550590 isoform X2 [Mercenaria mercenaria]|uniref:uncharacterized protein LOC123550590 isoform X2 n=1 Tax=Mercenaria mercenaria TaxID=6596 RepID=UPI00234E9818|nr:uncharacterized protein LOC123550590 isoform X2 [Mercenaria mercenaria]
MFRITLVALAALLGSQGAQGAGTTAAPNCGSNPADIVFLLDSSGSVGSSNFQKQLDFVAKFGQAFDIGPRNVQIGVVTFASTPHNEFNLNTHLTKHDLVTAVHKIGYHSGGTRTDLALKYVEANSFTKPAGDRPGVANILIVMTDGKSNMPQLTLDETKKLHNLNAKVFAIGIGSGVDRNELGHIATDSKHVFQVSNFNALDTLQAELKKTACKIDGGWTKFGSYSPCTKSCGGGTQFRERSCTNPRPANGGAQCTGNAKETRQCHTNACPTKPPPTTTTTPKTTPIPTTLAAGCNGTEPADIVFILDASGSVGATNFNKMLEFVKKLVDGFPVGPTETHIGLITFDSKTYLQFHLNKYMDKASIKKAVTSTRYTSGTTHTSDAIKYARQTAFSTQNGMRPNAAKIAIIVTDGQSNNAAATASEAALLRKNGITVFSIGVGSGAKRSELNAMATDPDATHVFTVTNFASLDNIKGSLSKKTCEVKATTLPPTTPAPKKADCEAQADIVFLLDSSGSVGSGNFQKVKSFVHDLMNSFNIGPGAVQVGVDTFQSSVKSEFNLNTYHDRQSVQTAINKIPYHSGGTNTAKALTFVKADSFTAAHGDRPKVPNVAIVVTDGRSSSATATAAEAKKLRDAGAIVLAIGVGSGVSKTELNAIATDPDSTHVFAADNFDALKSLKALLSTKACEVSKPVVNTTKTCAAKADIVFILDSSGSIGQSNYNKMLSFVRDVSSKFDIGPDKVRIGTEIFSDRTYIQFNLNKYNDGASVDKAIGNIPYKRGTTNTGQALKDAYSKMFTAGNGDRPGVPNIAIVVTDGRSTNRPTTLSEAKKLRDSGAQVFTVGVGSGVDKSELNAVATDPDSSHVLQVTDFSKLTQITASLNSKACAAIPPTGQSLTPKPGTTIVPDACQDQNVNCHSYDIPKVCTDYAGWARDNCQRSCGFCPNVHATAPPPCVDAIPNCHEYSPSACRDFQPWASDNCRQFCGFCNIGNGKQVLTGFFGKCYYGGKTYNQGQTWDDGCAYECTCDDATQGRYSCYNKCPLYYNLPPQCTLVSDGSCCLKPVCDFKGTHLTTNGQTVGKYNGVNVCMYKNQPYYQGQTWQDGCDKSCYCQDGSVGLWTCQSLCGHYDNLPSQCHLERAAGKCCEEPVCTFNKQFGQFTGAGTLSGKGAGATVMTTPPPCADKDANCVRYPKGTCSDVQYAGWARDNCAKFCGFCDPSAVPTPGPNDVCVYNGNAYRQGQRWDDGCNLECVCENAQYGFYRCQKKCADVVNLPLGCTQVKAQGDCCPKIQCSGTGGTFTGSQTVPGTIGGYPVPSPMVTPAPGQTLAPGMIPTAQPGQITGALNGCLYKGTLYSAGRRWDDGCDYTCVCNDASTGQYKCTPKCPTFTNLPSSCQMQDNPNDPCCKQPVCTPGTGTGTSGSSVVPIPTYGKGFTGYGRPVMPSIGSGTSGMNPTPIPGQPVGITGSGRGCAYNGKVYMQGQTWDQGCTYRCECVDASAGQYRCTERCTAYTNIPPQCSLITDPSDSCCKTIKCDFTKPVTTIAPLFAQTTPVAGAAFCKYQGYYHRQGEVWNDGCGLTCRCEDASNQYYQCTDRCPKYDNVPSTCTFVADPKDPQCCRVPQCQGTGQGVQGFTGSFVGYGRPPNVDPTSLAKTGYGSACLYKGQVYQQGNTWQDGCDYECECTDATKGMYRCTERCQRIASVPNGCHFAQDPNDACCQVLKCDPTSSLGTCKDAIGNCAGYGSYICGANYKGWAQQNCAKYCGYCGGGTNPLSGSTGGVISGECKDTVPNCDQYSSTVCTDPQYDGWVNANCRKYCNKCGSGTGTGTGTGGTGTGTGTGGTGTGTGTGTGGTGTGTGTGMTGTGTSGSCVDVQTNCAEYTQAACVDPYIDWAKKNCARFCGYCGMTGTGTGTGGGSITGFQTAAPGSGFTGFSGGCVYKGKYYGANDEWVDGCDYNCTCVNGQTGFYRCVDRCPTYSLPAGCVLRKPAGQCCGVPDCTGAGTGTGGTGTGGTGSGTSGTGTMTGNTQGCFYNNKLYQQGQTWKDGCKYNCQCVNAATGQYSCAALCLNWQLPSACHLDPPAAGKCCQTPNCPAGYTLNYPAGWDKNNPP